MADDKKLATELEAREVAEYAREQEWERRSFARSIFEGRFELDLIHPHPVPDPEEQERAAGFLEKLEAFSRDHIDGDRSTVTATSLKRFWTDSRSWARSGSRSRASTAASNCPSSRTIGRSRSSPRDAAQPGRFFRRTRALGHRAHS